MTFRVGQRVICVDDRPLPRETGSRWVDGEGVIAGQVYTIKRVYVNSGHHLVWLEEVARSDIAMAVFGPDVGYGQFRFRPLAERETDISIFTSLLTPSKPKQLVDG